MSASAPQLKLACRKRLRSCDSSKRNIQSGDEEEEKGKKIQNGDGKVKNTKTSLVFLEKEKEKKKVNNNNNIENKTLTDDNKEGEKKIYNEVKNGKASPTFFEKVKRKEELKVYCSKRNMHTEEYAKEDLEIWNDQSKSKRRKVSTVSYEREERRKRSNDHNCGEKIPGNCDEREDNYMWNCDSKLKDEEVTATSSEKEKKKKRDINNNGGMKWLQSDLEEEKQMRNLHFKIRNGESSATFFEKGKERKRLNSTNSEKKFQRDDKKYEKDVEDGHYKVKSWKVSAASYVQEKKKKMPSRDNVEKKINGADRNTSISFSKNKMQNNNGKKRTEPITNVVNEKKMRPYESAEMKMQHDIKHKRNVPSDISKEKKTKAPIDGNYEKRKRKESNTLFKKVKRMQSYYNKKKIHSGKVKEKNCGDGEEKKRNTSFSFFKVICNNFKEFLSIPPKVASELEDLTNHHVYLEDSEGKFSKIRLSVVDGFLAFHQGWNNFVSDHLIKWGEFLLFEYTAKLTFSVRIFGRDSCERLHFDVGRKRDGVRKTEMHTNRSHDDLISFDVKSEDSEDDYYFSDEYPRNKEPGTHHVTVHTAEDPKRVERMVGCGLVPLDNMNRNEVIQQCRTKGMSPLCSKEKRVILITDSGSSIQENDTVELTTSTGDSDTHHVAADTNEDTNRVQSGIGNGQSAVVGVEKGRLTDVECRTKRTSPKCSEKKAASSVQSGFENESLTVVEDENGSLPDVECVPKCTSPKRSEKKVLSVDEAPLAHENDDISKDDLKLHDSDEDLGRKQEISSTNLEFTTSVNKYNNDDEMKSSPDVCRNYEAPGGFRCLEKWKNSIVRDQAVLDGTGLIKPERTQETDSKFVVEYGAVGVNPSDKCVLSKDTHACSQQIFTIPIEDPAHPDRVSTCEHSATESNHSIDGKGEAKKELLEPVGSIENTPRDNSPICANLITACHYGAIGLNPVRSEGSSAFVELQPSVPIKNPSSPDRISKCGDSRTEVNDDIDGIIAKLETNMGYLEPMGSIVGIQTTDIHVCANNAAACQSEHCFLKKEDTNSVDFSTPAKPEIQESDDRSVLMVNLQFCIANTTRKWLELPKSLSNAVRQRRQDRSIIMLKDPMKRLWPVFYHENSIFVGFTSGWKHFAAANDLQSGDLCELFKEPGDEEPVYSVQITKK